MIGEIKKLKYFGYFKNNPYFYLAFAKHHILSLLGKTQVMSVELFFDTRCNFNCWHCSSSSWVNKKGKTNLSIDEIEQILKNLKTVGALTICYVGGEPTIRPDLVQIIKLTDKYKILPSIITNGYMLTGAKIDELFKAGLANMGFSIQSMDPETHDKLVSRKGAFERIMKAIDYCIKKKYVCSICVVPTNENLANGDFDKMMEFATKRKIRVNVNLPAPVGKLTDKEKFLLKPDAVEKLVKKYFKYENFLPDFKINSQKSEVYCPMGENVVYIFPNGDVCPCTFVHITFGNALEEPMKAVLKRLRGSKLIKGVNRINQCPISMDKEFIKKVNKSVSNSGEIPVKWTKS